jgi:hypothetical protein
LTAPGGTERQGFRVGACVVPVSQALADGEPARTTLSVGGIPRGMRPGLLRPSSPPGLWTYEPQALTGGKPEPSTSTT